jgi:hypothetical protein
LGNGGTLVGAAALLQEQDHSIGTTASALVAYVIALMWLRKGKELACD